MLNNASKYEEKYFVRTNSSFPSPIPPAFLLNVCGRISTELWWTNQEFYPVGIIPPWFSMLMYHLMDEH
jgi:hypothetical protein